MDIFSNFNVIIKARLCYKTTRN